MAKRIIIIGAGLSGLSAGIFLKRAGFDTEIFEQAPWAGGLCSAWVRKGYRFDGCIQWIPGIRKEDPNNQIMTEIGALRDDIRIHIPKFLHLEINGTRYGIPLNFREFREFMLGMSNRDNLAIEGFCKDIAILQRLNDASWAASEVGGSAGRGVGGQYFRLVKHKYVGITVKEYADRFKGEEIGSIFTNLVPGEFSAFMLLTRLGQRFSGNAGYPLGGTGGIIERMVACYTSLGGKIFFNTKADEIIVVGNEAKGVRSNGICQPADGVIAACGVQTALNNLLGNRYRQPQLESLLTRTPPFAPLGIVSYGLDRQLGIPFALTCEVPEGLNVAPGIKRHTLTLRSLDFDPSAAPSGCSSVMALFEAPLDYWKNLRLDRPGSYRLQKELLADHIASKIEKRFPGFKDAVCVVDVATPATFNRLTNAGSSPYEGIVPTPDALRKKIKKTVPGLKRFCLCGPWITPGGGIGAALADGRVTAAMMEKELK